MLRFLIWMEQFMSRKTDVIIIGSGLAGLMAAYSAAKKGARTRLISEGMGNLSISPGCIDILGYDSQGKQLADPWSGIQSLDSDHPYTLLGQDVIRESVDYLVSLLAARGLDMAGSKNDDNIQANTPVPTIMGTLKPSWLVQDSPQALEQLKKAKRILVLSVAGFRDCRPSLIASQLARYSDWSDRSFDTQILPMPFTDLRRSINALDLAHYLDRAEGRDWFFNRIKGLGKNHDLVLLPPMLGQKPDSRVRKTLQAELGSPFMELLSVPPGVSGLRIRHALIDTLVDMGVEIYENAQVREATTQGNKAVSIRLHSSGRDMEHKADAFVIATGGIIGGGIILGEGKASEAIFGTSLSVPANVDDWSEKEVFGAHLISRLGMKVNNRLQVAGLDNVYYAGRTLGGYDYAREKSGHGVACATGWQAGRLAAEQAQGGNK